MVSLPYYQDSSLFSFEWYHNLSMHKSTQATAGSPSRTTRGKHMAGTGRLEGPTACRRPTRPMKSRPVWIPDQQDTRQSLGESSESCLGMVREIFWCSSAAAACNCLSFIVELWILHVAFSSRTKPRTLQLLNFPWSPAKFHKASRNVLSFSTVFWKLTRFYDN